MSDDLRCPECGGPVGPAATYCLHCSADLTDREPIDALDRMSEPGRVDSLDDDVVTNVATASGGTVVEQPIDPDGFVDDTLTVVVGIVGGIVVGVVGSFVLAVVTGSPWALAFGFVAWLAATAYLVRRRSVLDAVSKAGYAVGAVLLLVPVMVLSPAVSMDGGLVERAGAFAVMLLLVAVPGGIAIGIGWVASRYVPADVEGGEG